MHPSIYGRCVGDMGSPPFIADFNHNNVKAFLTSDLMLARERVAEAFADRQNRIALFSDHHIRNTKRNEPVRDLHSRTMNGRSLPTYDSGVELVALAIAHCVEHRQRLSAFSISDDPESMIDQVRSKIDCAIDPELIRIEPLQKIALTERDRWHHDIQYDDVTGCNATATAARIVTKLHGLMVDFGIIQSVRSAQSLQA
jgi:hypothetical protein